MSTPQDDGDLEVSSLASLSSSPPSGLGHADATRTSGATGDGQPPSQRGRTVSPTARRSRRQQAVRGGSAFLLLALLLCGVFLLPSGNRAAVLRVLIPPTPSTASAPLPGGDAFLWEHSVPWGQLIIDGKPGPDVRGSAVRPSAGPFLVGAAFHLSRGRHALEYHATPFPPLDCVVSVPASRIDTCPLEHATDYSFLAPDAPATRLLDLQATIGRLPKAQVDALVLAAQGMLTELAARLPVGTLSIGDHYLDATGQLTQATSTLQITPQFRLDEAVKALDGSSCVALCTPSGLLSDVSPTGDWPLLAPVALSWRYTNTARLVIQDSGPATLAGTSPITMISLLTRWQDGGWQPPLPVVDGPQTDPVICPTGAHALDVLRVTPGQIAVEQTFQVSYLASTAELGCLLIGSATEPTSGTPTGARALVLYRAGVLVAVNAEAHRAFPTLPAASAHEHALAQAVAPGSLG